MIPLDVFGSESVAASLLQQVRWRDGVSCLRCRSDCPVKNGSYGRFQRYPCENYDRTFTGKTGTIFAHPKVTLRKWLFSIYTFLRFNTSLRQLHLETDVQYKTLYQRVERFTKALDAPSLSLAGPVEIDEVCVSCWVERPRVRPGVALVWPVHAQWGSYHQDKPPVFTIIDRGIGQRYLITAKLADKSTVCLLLAVCEMEPLTVYTAGFHVDKPLEEDDAFEREYVVHRDGKYVDDDVHVNTCESRGSLLRP